MSKYQEALERLGAEKLARGELIRNDSKVEPYLSTLQELVDKETPMKVDIKNNKKIKCDKYLITLVTYYKCPNKKCEFHNNYNILVEEKRCPNCGQKLDWGDECE